MKEEKMSDLIEEIKNCKRCGLWESRTNVVPGEGSINAEIMFIGEGPGYWEDQKGRPFVGRAGKVLDELLEFIGLKREEIFIANILKCRPPKNRNPEKEEIKACTPYLEAQISIINPKIIAPLGKFAMEFIFEKFGLGERKISEVHGKVFEINTINGKIKIIPLYHPAVAVYNSNKIDLLKEDFKKLIE
ncbi:MAG: uracil-DNA glycosylase [Candidatus Aenigmarchaeota archaeon]|nr:uracil-DNA glycosylase [Candidatus Aenigmarchaeota archaeon]